MAWPCSPAVLLLLQVRPLVLDPTTAAPLTITVEYPPLVWGRPGVGGLLLKGCQVREKKGRHDDQVSIDMMRQQADLSRLLHAIHHPPTYCIS